MNRAYKYRIYPNKSQIEILSKTFGCCRFIWNQMLSDKINYYKKTGNTLQTTPAQYKNEFSFLKEVDSLALANVQLNLQTAYKNFFRDKKTGFPKFKSRKTCRFTYTTNNQKGTIEVFDGKIKLPKIGKIKAVVHRIAPDDWKLKSATVSMERDGSYYVSVLYEYETYICKTLISEDTSIGLDYKSDGLYMDSNGNIADMPHYYRQSQNKLTKLQRNLSKKQKASSNRNKAKTKIAKLSRHVVNQRKDFLHKLSAEITNQYSLICVEDLNMMNLSSKGFRNGKATLDNGYGMFLVMVEYKQQAKGHHFVKVDKWYPSSQICGCCGFKNPIVKDLSVRKWVCPECNTTHDRDLNAANNIKKEGYCTYLLNAVA